MSEPAKNDRHDAQGKPATPQKPGVTPPGRLHVVTVHGTFSGRANITDAAEADREFFSEKSEFAQTLKGALKDNRPVSRWYEFGWNGANLESDRRKSSKKFSRFIKKLDIRPEDDLLVLAHSHGGNVALDGLRKAPVNNRISLYTFGTPFIWKETRFFLAALAIILPNIIFFLAVLAIAAVIGLGHFQSLAYGIPFIEVPRNVAATEFFENFNAHYAVPAAFLMSVLAAFFLIVWPLKKSRYRARFKYLDVDRFRLARVWRTDDEAIAMLATEPKIAVPITIFNSFFRFLSAGLFVGFVLWAAQDGYSQFRQFRDNIDSTLSWNFVLPFGAEKIGLGLSILLLLMAIYPIIQFIFKKPLTWLMSRPVNSLLRKTAMGEDGYIRIDAQNKPDIPRQFVTELNETHHEMVRIMDEVKTISDAHLVEHRTTIMKTLSTGDGYMQEILHDTDLTKSLIHCNYFTNAMARYIAEREQRAHDNGQ